MPKSLSVAAFYSKSSKLQLPYSVLTEEVQAVKARNQLTLKESKDPCINNARIKVDGGRKANTPAVVQDAKSSLRMKDIAGIANIGREGLGLRKRQYYSMSANRDQRSMVVDEIREKEEEKRKVKLTGLPKQGQCTRWEVPQRKMTHDTF